MLGASPSIPFLGGIEDAFHHGVLGNITIVAGNGMLSDLGQHVECLLELTNVHVGVIFKLPGVINTEIGRGIFLRKRDDPDVFLLPDAR